MESLENISTGWDSYQNPKNYQSAGLVGYEIDFKLSQKLI